MPKRNTSTEEREHLALASWLDAKRVLWCHPSPNVYRAALAKYKTTPWNIAHKARALGVKAGVPDILIFTKARNDRPTAVELKRCQDDGPSRIDDKQERWLDGLKRCGWNARVCYGCEEALDYLTKLGY